MLTTNQMLQVTAVWMYSDRHKSRSQSSNLRNLQTKQRPAIPPLRWTISWKQQISPCQQETYIPSKDPPMCRPTSNRGRGVRAATSHWCQAPLSDGHRQWISSHDRPCFRS